MTVKNALVKRSILCATAVSMLASAMVKASTSLAMGYGSQLAFEKMKPCWP